ncbi:DUF2066 domain-containing protein [Oleiagrimonas sp.]|jgi:hypothetical protein|uniref:DUF2066 domain-containing protein n=1 Tax=Oleiagrimonas sp. TaxID=2010330 RepID=UPI002622B433|nr:DUF2066 domain-containing protein [Oleiagrimonas sp.]MDA3914047.1 DUF2066 domain-containing protein [Oleiagrimonas sp.]
MRIRTLLFILVAALCAALPMHPARAQSAGYKVTIPVTDTTAAQRNHAFAVGLGMVLTRQVGNTITGAQGYSDALGKAANLVQNYQYQRAPAGSASPFVLQVSFDTAAVQQLAQTLQKQLQSAADEVPGAIVTQGGKGTLWVSHMDSAMDLAHLLALLRSDNRVKSVEPIAADGHGVMLQISTSAPLQVVLGSLKSKGHLQPDAIAHSGANASMNWLR